MSESLRSPIQNPQSKIRNHSALSVSVAKPRVARLEHAEPADCGQIRPTFSELVTYPWLSKPEPSARARKPAPVAGALPDL